MRCRLHQDVQRHLQRPRHAVALVALAVRMHRHVHRDHQRRQTGVLRPLDHVVRDLFVLGRIHLVPAVIGSDLGQVLDGVGRGAGHDERHIGLAGRCREHQVGTGAEERGTARRCDADRLRVGASEQFRRLRALRHVDHVAWHDAVALEAPHVALEAHLVVEAALDEVEGDLRQTALGGAAQVVVVEQFSHGVRDPRRCALGAHGRLFRPTKVPFRAHRGKRDVVCRRGWLAGMGSRSERRRWSGRLLVGFI